ncbi:MAG: VOC family protein [Chitinophagaceae bacterium]|nr:MAG: VOC family protein [Chitinophagaceae bacterium]
MESNKHTTIKPFLTVSNGKAAVDFYKSAFGAIEIQRFEMTGHKISSVLEIESAQFYVADEEPENGNLAPAPQHTSAVRMILYTHHADELFNQALQSGATQICPMTTEEDWRIGKLKDPFGHMWELGFEL